MYSQSSGDLLPTDLNELSFDSFDRDPSRDIVCVPPVRTIVRREEEVQLVRRIRKVEDVDANPACPVSQQVAVPVPQPEKKMTREMAYQA
jgi:hypothetical protein